VNRDRRLQPAQPPGHQRPPATGERMMRVWTVYRYYDAEGRLLYVGVTGCRHRRAHDHAGGPASWWLLVVRGEFDHFTSPEEALAEELRQIVELAPLHNRVGKNPHRRLRSRTWPPLTRRRPGDTKRAAVESHLSRLSPDQLAVTTGSSITAALTAQGTPVGETYAGQILGEWRTAHPSPNGSRRKR
jgi:hypothetical protein